jgi:ACS family hexuronate transporter-like MFS transporter
MPHRRWFFVGLAFFATVINYLDRQTLSVAAPELRKQLHFGDIEYSWIVNGFLLAYTVMNGVSGPLIDRLGTKRGYALCMLWWSAASVLHGFVSSPLGLGVCRFLLGMGEAGNWPAAIKLVSEWFPPKERPLASGIFNSGSAIGALLAPPLIAYLLISFGWQTAFWMVGASGFVWLAVWWLFYYTPPQVEEEREPAPAALPLLRERFVWSLLLAKLFFDPVWYFYIFWFPQYLSTAHGFTIAQIGAVAWIPFATADVGNLAGGALSGYLLRRGCSAESVRRTVFLLFPLCMTSAIPAVLMQSSAAAIALVSLATFGYTACLANMLALPGEGYPRNSLGSIWGLASMGSGFGGMLFTFLTGRVVASYSYVPVFIAFGIMPLITAAILRWVSCPAIERRLLKQT